MIESLIACWLFEYLYRIFWFFFSFFCNPTYNLIKFSWSRTQLFYTTICILYSKLHLSICLKHFCISRDVGLFWEILGFGLSNEAWFWWFLILAKVEQTNSKLLQFDKYMVVHFLDIFLFEYFQPVDICNKIILPFDTKNSFYLDCCADFFFENKIKLNGLWINKLK